MKLQNPSHKKADMAIGTLIIFIAMVLVAAIAAGVIIQTATALQNKALLTGERAKSQVGTGIQTILIYGENGDDKDLESFYIKLKLSPGSDAIKFDDMLLEIDTKTSSSDSIYGERVRLLNYTSVWHSLDADVCDLNNDEYTDYVRLLNTTHLQFNISNGTSTNYFLYNASLTFASGFSSIASASTSNPVELETYSGVISVDNTRYGTYHVVGETTSATYFTEDVVLIIGHGTALEQGAYSVDYLLKSSTWKEGYLQRGDIAKLALVAPHSINEDEEIDVRIIPKTGIARTVAIVVPDLVSAKRVYMFS